MAANSTENGLNINISQWPVPVDSCGRILKLSFTNNIGDWQWLTRVSFPILLALGTVGNIYGIFFGWTNHKHSQRIFVISMCSVSLLSLWNQLIIMLGMRTWDTTSDDSTRSVYAPFYVPTGGFFLYMDQIFYLASEWILLVFCLERCVAIIFPLFHYTKKRRCFSGLTIALAFLLSALVGILAPVLYYWNLAWTGTFAMGQPIRQLPRSLYIWKEVDTWWESLFTIAVYLVVLGCNLVLARSLHLNRRGKITGSTSALYSNNSSSGSDDSSHCSNDKIIVNSKSVPGMTRTQILLASSLFYLVTQSLKVIMTLLALLTRPPACAFQITMDFLAVYDPFNAFLQNLYFALEFVFLVWLGAKERKKLRSICCCESSASA